MKQEVGIKRQVLNFGKGVTNVPSDILSDDDCLLMSEGMVMHNGEYMVVQEGVVIGNSGEYRILYKHDCGERENWIATKDGKLWYGGLEEWTELMDGEALQVEAIGRTLVVNTEQGLMYFLWKDGKYKNLGNGVPWVDVKFHLGPLQYDEFQTEEFAAAHNGYFYDYGATYGLVVSKENDSDLSGCQAIEDWIVGNTEKGYKRIYEKGGFPKPFMVRYALEMYDGTYANISSPMPMYPVERGGTMAHVTLDKTTYEEPIEKGKTGYTQRLMSFRTYYADLYAQINTVLSEYSDIVKRVVVFVTDDVPTYDFKYLGYVENKNNAIVFGGKKAVEEFGYGSASGLMKLQRADNVGTWQYNESLGVNLKGWYLFEVENIKAKRQTQEIVDELRDKGVFYKLCSFDVADITVGVDTKLNTKIGSKNLADITTSEVLGNDDYYSLCPKSCDNLVFYNKRLHLCGLKRGFTPHCACGCRTTGDNQNKVYNYWVEIDTDSGTKIVKIDSEDFISPVYFYYPDPRARRIYRGTTYLEYGYELSPHKTLNGAVYMTYPGNTGGGKFYNKSLYLNEIFESLGNEVHVSEAGNPYVFPAKGVVNIGNGDLIGLAANCTAVSQGQFGAYPMIAFSTEGIWAMSVGNDGWYSSVHPMSREVCCNPKSITQTDNAVFFMSKRGLNIVSGSTVALVSKQLCGWDVALEIENSGIRDYINDCVIAYDYRDRMLWICNEADTKAIIYDMDSGCFGSKQMGSVVYRVVNDYPDNLLCMLDGRIIGLLDRPDISQDGNVYSARLVSRCLKLGSVYDRKSVREVNQLMRISGSLKVRIWGSDDGNIWQELDGTMGRSWRYFRFGLEFIGLSAKDTWSGMAVDSVLRLL